MQKVRKENKVKNQFRRSFNYQCLKEDKESRKDIIGAIIEKNFKELDCIRLQKGPTELNAEHTYKLIEKV